MADLAAQASADTVSLAGNAAPSDQKREAPSEPPSVQWTRRWIILSFWAIVVLLGLPHWLWTTSTYRAALPLEKMNQWDEGKACLLKYPLSILLSANEQHLAANVHSMLGQSPKSSVHSYSVATSHLDIGEQVLESGNEHYDLFVRLDLDESAGPQQREARLRSEIPVLDLTYGMHVIQRDLEQWIVEQIRSVFADEEASLLYRLSETPYARDAGAFLGQDTKQRLDARSTRAFKYASTYHLTFSLFTSGSSPSSWDISEALEQYIQPLVSSLSGISKCTIDTQVQLHAAFSPSIAGPLYDPGTKEWKLHKSDLSGFINAAEWPLSPSIGAGPTINFVLYVPSKDQSPLSIAETGGTSWLIPQWGGMQILNTATTQPEKLTVEDLEGPMMTFAEQLTALVGMPATPASLAIRLQSLARERTTSLILSTSSTLGALARLTLKLTSIAIPDSVAKAVDSTLQHLDNACADLTRGNYDDALAHARTANDEAERAFFEPSMVGQVYFPDEHKVAVYVPLLGPMAVPLVMAALKEVKGLRDRRKAKMA